MLRIQENIGNDTLLFKLEDWDVNFVCMKRHQTNLNLRQQNI